ncbi:hypothetical protein GCM10009596_02240 [Arthrobacter rhombi]|uniref:hypothetical protein n=1 Tax=Arthrobacter rhombi TaxID=71253 RepID=UPI0031CEC093
MAIKSVAATRNAKTGSYTVRVQKSATSGKFVAQSVKPGRIEIQAQAKKSS